MDDNNTTWITVAEAAKRLNRSIEQVRRYLREGKLAGRRIGNQWFVDAAAAQEWPSVREPVAVYEVRTMNRIERTDRGLVSADLARSIDMIRKKIRDEVGLVDVVALIREDRDAH